MTERLTEDELLCPLTSIIKLKSQNESLMKVLDLVRKSLHSRFGVAKPYNGLDAQLWEAIKEYDEKWMDK